MKFFKFSFELFVYLPCIKLVSAIYVSYFAILSKIAQKNRRLVSVVPFIWFDSCIQIACYCHKEEFILTIYEFADIAKFTEAEFI